MARTASNAERRVWVFREACGCAFGVHDVDRDADTRSKVWREFFIDAKGRNAAMDRGVTVEEMDFTEYKDSVYPMLLTSWVCPHGGVS